MESETKELDYVSRQVSSKQYFVKFSYHNRLRMLDYKLDSKNKDPGYISSCIEGITESIYKDLYNKVYLESVVSRQMPHERERDRRNYRRVLMAINQFANLSSIERYEYLKKVSPRITENQRMDAILAQHRQRD